jgi:hypothetical protein
MRAAARIVERFTENVDIMPTMLDYIGAEIPGQCDGLSLRPFLEGRAAPANWRSEAHWEFDFRNPADNAAEQALDLTLHQCTMNIVRDARYKYVHFTKLPPLFFDLEKDPGEFVDRAGDPAYLPLVLEYAQKLLSWRMNHDEQTLTHIAADAGARSSDGHDRARNRDCVPRATNPVCSVCDLHHVNRLACRRKLPRAIASNRILKIKLERKSKLCRIWRAISLAGQALTVRERLQNPGS